MLDTELVTLDSDAVRCNISGFLPLHAVTANRLTDMYNWLTDRRCDAAPLEPGRDPLICRAAGPMLEPGILICIVLWVAADPTPASHAVRRGAGWRASPQAASARRPAHRGAQCQAAAAQVRPHRACLE